MNSMLLIFIALNVANVVLQTVKSLATVKCGKCAASAINAVAYGVYTIVLVYMSYPLSLWAKVAVTAGANLVGVFVVKLIEEKMRKDRLWKVEFTIKDSEVVEDVDSALASANISHNAVLAGEHFIFNCYCATQFESEQVKSIIDKYGAKYFATETKIL